MELRFFFGGGSYGKSLQVFEVVMTGTQVQPAWLRHEAGLGNRDEMTAPDSA